MIHKISMLYNKLSYKIENIKISIKKNFLFLDEIDYN